MAALTKEFIETIISQPILDFSIKAGSKPGDNVASDLLAVQVTTESNEILNLVYKTLPTDPEARGWIIEKQIFEVETAFYQGVLPTLKRLLGKSKIRDFDSNYLPFPKCYASVSNGDQLYLCLEDLRPGGFVMPDKFLGFCNTEVTLILKELAKFHALGYFLIKQEGEKFFDGPITEIMVNHSFWCPDKLNWSEIEMTFGGSYALATQLVRERDPSLADKMAAKFESQNAAGRLVKGSACKTDSEYFPVIVCGDLWTNNILIKYGVAGDRETAEAVKFLDFQQSHRGCIYEDLQYFFLTSTTPKERRQHWVNWESVYYKAFMSTLKDVGCPPPPSFTRGYFVDELWKSLIPGFVYHAFAIPFQLGNPVPTPEDLAEPPPVITSAEEGTRHMILKFRKWMDRSPRAVDRLVEVAAEFAQLGII